MRVTEVSTDDRIYDMYLDYREDGLPPEEAKLSVAWATEYDYEAVEEVLQNYNIEELKTMKQKQESQEQESEVITIEEEVSIPGTGVILEKGDKIQQVNEAFDFIDDLYNKMDNWGPLNAIETLGAYVEDNYSRVEQLASSDRIEDLLNAISRIVD